MSKSEHTPGPWTVGIMESPRSNDTHPRRDFAYYIQGNPEKCTLSFAVANARLIAASPELLDELKLILESNIETRELQYADGTSYESERVLVYQEQLNRIRALVARIEGSDE